MSFHVGSHRGVRIQAARAGWTIEDVRLLRTLAMQGVPVEAIAAALGRTTSAIRNKAGMHGISVRGPRRPDASRDRTRHSATGDPDLRRDDG